MIILVNGIKKIIIQIKKKKLEHILPLIIKDNGTYQPINEHRKAWELIKNPLMPNDEHQIYQDIRMSLDIPKKKFICNESYSKIISKDSFIKTYIDEVLHSDFFIFHNPIIKHTILEEEIN